MTFIKKIDFRISIQDKHLDQLTGSDDTIFERGLYEGIREVESYLQNAFDVAAIFVEYPEYDAGTTYPAEIYLWDGDYLYQSQVDGNIGNTPATDDGTNWKKSDPRNPRLVQVIRDVTLYHLHSAITPHNVPEMRYVRYKDATQWLKDLRSGDVATNLPKPVDADGNSTSKYPGLTVISARPSEDFYY